MSRPRTRVQGSTQEAPRPSLMLQQQPPAAAPWSEAAPSPKALTPPSPRPLKLALAPVVIHAAADPGTPTRSTPTAAAAAAASAAAAAVPGTGSRWGTNESPLASPQIFSPAAPRVWTPQQRRMSARSAIAQEVEDMADSVVAPRASHSSGPATLAAGAAGPAAAGDPAGAANSYSNAFYNRAFEDAAATDSRAHGGGSGTPTAARPRCSTAGGAASSRRPSAVMQNTLFGDDRNGTAVTAFNHKETSTAAAAAATAAGGAAGALQGSRSGSYGSILAVAAAGSASPVRSAQPSTPSAAAGAIHRPWSTAIANGYTAAAWEADVRRLVAAGQHHAALSQHGPTSGLARCYIKRYKNLLGTHCTVEVYMESWDQLLLAGRRRKKSACSKFLLGLTPEDTHRQASGVVAKLRSDFLGREYTLWQKGGNPAADAKGYGAQTLAVSYKPTATSMKCHSRSLTVAVPQPGEEEWLVSLPGEGADSLMGCLQAAHERALAPQQERHLCMLHTMKPFYDHTKKVHYLDFKGRVTKSSLKNFQLVHWDHNSNQLGTDMVLLFGKKDANEFAMDFAYPLNLLQATALALSSIDTKLSTAV